MKIHSDITLDAVLNGVRSGDYCGFCVYCGKEAYGVEPDAREYVCENCDEPGVYGAEELLFHMA